MGTVEEIIESSFKENKAKSVIHSGFSKTKTA